VPVLQDEDAVHRGAAQVDPQDREPVAHPPPGDQRPPPEPRVPAAGCRFEPRCLYAQDRCREEMPPLMLAETPGHEYRCWFPWARLRARRRSRRTSGRRRRPPASTPPHW
jgi:oligopeptide/dipeptide ABC transporter ATP-binding protein